MDPALYNKVKALGRGGVWFVSGYFVAKGWVSFDNAVMAVGAVLTLLAGGLTTQAHTDSSIAQAAAKVKSVETMVISDPKLAKTVAAAAPETRVVVAEGG